MRIDQEVDGTIIDHPAVQDVLETVRSNAVEAGVPLVGLGFGVDDVDEKAANDHKMLNLGSTTGALKQTVSDWFDAYAGERTVNE